MANILKKLSDKHASEDVIVHCLYGYYFLKLPIKQLAVIYKKHRQTISSWIKRYESTGLFSRKRIAGIDKKFDDAKRDWIVKLYTDNPLLYLEEAKAQFESHFKMKISTSTICIILHQRGFTYKTIERRAIQVNLESIYKFQREISSIQWIHSCLLFLDEVSIDNRCMLRNRGYAIKGQKIIHRGEFRRRPRESLLCFLGEGGVQETYTTKGTFNRLKFFEACKNMALSGKVQPYPGRNSVWIMDGARIHCDRAIIYYLRSLGIFPIFLPPYCPFFNPIEYIFGYLKKELKKVYIENQNRELIIVILETLKKFQNFNSSAVFRKCGYIPNGTFDPDVGMGQELSKFGFEK